MIYRIVYCILSMCILMACSSDKASVFLEESFVLDIKNNGGSVKLAVSDNNAIALYVYGNQYITIYNKECQLQEEVKRPSSNIENIYYAKDTLIVITVNAIYKYNRKKGNWEEKAREKNLLFQQFVPNRLLEKILSCNPKIPVSIRNLNISDDIPQSQYFFWEEQTNKIYQKLDNFLIEWDQKDCTLSSKAYFFNRIAVNHSFVKHFDSAKRIVFVHNGVNKLYCQKENVREVLFELKNNGDVNQLPFWVDPKKEFIISFSWDKEKHLVLTKNYYKI